MTYIDVDAVTYYVNQRQLNLLIIEQDMRREAEEVFPFFLLLLFQVNCVLCCELH